MRAPEAGASDGARGGREVTFGGLKHSRSGQRNQVEPFHGVGRQVQTSSGVHPSEDRAPGWRRAGGGGAKPAMGPRCTPTAVVRK